MFLISSDYYEIRETKGKGNGVFAKKDIPGGSVIGDYLGVVRHPSDIDEKSYGLYEMYLTDKISILPQRNTEGIHIINHSCCPNTEGHIYKGHILYYATRKIFAQEEITTDYQIGTLEDEDFPCPHQCMCNSPFCRGTMHNSEKLDKFIDNIIKTTHAKAKTSLKFEYNKALPSLSKYPKTVSDDLQFNIFSNFDLSPTIYKDKTLPPVEIIRASIRKTGRAVKFPHLKITIWGVLNGYIITKLIN